MAPMCLDKLSEPGQKIHGHPCCSSIPLAVYYQRLVLLDNIMIFWLLLSLDLLLDGWGRLSRLVLSGVCFGLAMFTKETAVFLGPAMLFIVYQQRQRHQGHFGVSWLFATGLVATVPPLRAAQGAVAGRLVLAFALFSIDGESLALRGARLAGLAAVADCFNLENQFWRLAAELAVGCPAAPWCSAPMPRCSTSCAGSATGGP